MRSSLGLSAPLLCATLAHAALAQTSLRTLTRPDAELPVGFTSIGSIRELSDGRVLITDPRDNTIHLASFATGKAMPVSRQGAGPREYESAHGDLLPFSGDSSMLFDSGNGRFLVFSPTGQAARTILADGKGGASLMDARWADRQGWVYTTTGEMGPGGNFDVPPRGQVRHGPDSTSIVRYSVARKAVETITRIRVIATEIGPEESGPDGWTSFPVRRPPFAPHDEWVAFADGRVAVVRSKDYHVDFYRDGQRTSGPATPYTPLPVTAADKELVRAAQRPKTAAASGPPRPVREPVWPAVKPPFGEQSAWAGANGELWVGISRKAGDSVPKFDVFDTAGVRRYTVALPAGSRVVGFGKRAVYVVRTDADDLKYLRRFDLK